MIHVAKASSITENVSTETGGTTWPLDKQSGNGFIVEGKIVGLYNQTVNDGKTLHRYLGLRVTPKLTRRREFDAQGVEREPTVTAATAVKQAAWSNQYNKTTANDHGVSHDALASELAAPQGAVSSCGYHVKDASHVHPAKTGVFEFWFRKQEASQLELGLDKYVRLKTLGNSIMIDTLGVIDEKSGLAKNYAGNGEGILGGWGDKILAQGAAAGNDDETSETDTDRSVDDWD